MSFYKANIRSVLVAAGISCDLVTGIRQISYFGWTRRLFLQGWSFSKERQKDHLEVTTSDLASETLVKLMIYQSMIMHRFLCYKTADNYHQYIHS